MTGRRYVGELDELLLPEDYDAEGARHVVRFRLRRLPDGRCELLADSPDAAALDQLMDQLAADLGAGVVEAMLCG